VLRANLKWKLVSQLVGSCLALMLTIGISSCEQSPPVTDNGSATNNFALTNTDGPLAEVNIPASIAQLAPSLDKYRPQVQILSPQPDEILADDRVSVKLKVTDLPLFKQPELGLGNHLHVILDRETYQGVYDLSQPLVFKNLAAGTHTLRVFASRPWHESFKNEGAFALVTFHVLTKTVANNPDPQQPLLTYSRPTGTYSTEPIMLDYYLTHVPSHPAEPGSQDLIPDWRVRVTIDDQRFILDRWAPVYLQGFKKGKNWVRLELVDDLGHPLPNVYNDTVGIVTYDPQTKDALAKLIRGELSPTLARTLVDPEAIELAPRSTPIPSISPAPVKTPAPTIVPTVPNPIAIVPAPEVQPGRSSGSTLAPSVKMLPVPTLPSTPMVKTQPNPLLESNQQSSDRVNPILKLPTETSPTTAPKIAPPTISPSPAPAPIVIIPVPTAPNNPVPVAKPNSAQAPAPKVAKTATPDPIEILIPVPSPPPTATSPPPAIAIVPSPQQAQPSDPNPATTTVPAPQLAKQPELPTLSTPTTAPKLVAVDRGEPTWQTQAIELVKLSKVKIRAFTNTIPAKSQRFGHNIQLWVGKASEFIEQLRDRG
jgi:hypothetical protein